MYKFVIGLFLLSFVILIDGCLSKPPKPLLPDGSHRVPINRIAAVHASPVSTGPAAASIVGAGS